MLKFLLIFLLVLMVLRRLLPWLLRRLVGGLVKEQAQRAGYQPPRQHPPDGRVRVDFVPPKSPRQPRPDGYRGGDYVDFEEVK